EVDGNECVSVRAPGDARAIRESHGALGIARHDDLCAAVPKHALKTRGNRERSITLVQPGRAGGTDGGVSCVHGNAQSPERLACIHHRTSANAKHELTVFPHRQVTEWL